MASRNGKGWNLSTKTWSKIGRASSVDCFKASRDLMTDGIRAFKNGDNKMGMSKTHLAKIYFKAGHNKVDWGKSQNKSARNSPKTQSFKK